MSDPTVEERAAAQQFAASNINLNLQPLTDAVAQVRGDGYLAGAIAGAQQTGAPIVAGLGGMATPGDSAAYWSTWTPGNAPAADLLQDGGLRALLSDTGVTIRNLADTTLDRLGSILADGAANGRSVDQIARDMHTYITDPRRAFMIADTETARAVSVASRAQYAAQGVGMVDWVISPDACPICQDYADRGPYPLDQVPSCPAHPYCRCSYSPVDPGLTSSAAGSLSGLGLSSGLEDAAEEAAQLSFTDAIPDEAADLTGLSDDELTDRMTSAALEDDEEQLKAIDAEFQARDDAAAAARAAEEKQAAKDAAKAAEDDRLGAEFDRLVDAGADPEEAYADVYGVSVEKQRTQAAIQQFRDEGFQGAGFDELSRVAWREQARLQYIEALEDPQTRGVLLTREGKAAGIDPLELFTGTEVRARKYASDELKEFWQRQGRLTLDNFRASVLGGRLNDTTGYWF